MSPVVQKRIAAVKRLTQSMRLKAHRSLPNARTLSDQLGTWRTNRSANEEGAIGTSSSNCGTGAPTPWLIPYLYDDVRF